MIQFSTRFIYTLSKRWDGISSLGGTSWWINRIHRFYGMAPEKLCPTRDDIPEEESLKLPIPIEAFLAAHGRRSLYYQRLYTPEDCMYAIQTKRPCAVEIDIFESIRTTPDGYVDIPKIGEKSRGSHCVGLLGYGILEIRGEKRKCFVFSNSWGSQWGDRGNGYLPIEYFEHGLVNSGWACVVPGLEDPRPIKKEKIKLKTKDKKKFHIEWGFCPPLRHTQYQVAIFNIYLEDSKFLLGCIHGSPVSKTEFEIEEFFISPDYQNKGYGAAALNFVESVASGYGFSKIVGWIGAQDLVQHRENVVIHFFQKRRYFLKEDNSRFKDAVYKFNKNLK